MKKNFAIAATTLAGLEDVLATELRQLGADDVTVQRRYVSFCGDKRLLYKANLWCRTAIRVLRPIKKFFARNEDGLYRQVQSIRWDQYLNANGTLAVDPIVYNSNFTHSLYVAQLAKDAIVDQFRKHYKIRPSVDLQNPQLRINLHIDRNNATLSLDSSGDSLHKRGYRIATTAVPINEVLAAGILLLCKWNGECHFIDPMCGSGTIPIEAALIALNRIPGHYRQQFGFMHWRDFDKELYQQLRQQARDQERTLTGKIIGSDVNKKATQIARENVRHADLENCIEIHHSSFEEQLPPPAPGLLVTNAPYGERQQVEELRGKYKRIGDTLKQKYAGYTAYIFTGNRQEAKHIGLRPSQKLPLRNGSLDCRLLRFDMYAGSRE